MLYCKYSGILTSNSTKSNGFHHDKYHDQWWKCIHIPGNIKYKIFLGMENKKYELIWNQKEPQNDTHNSVLSLQDFRKWNNRPTWPVALEPSPLWRDCVNKLKVNIPTDPRYQHSEWIYTKKRKKKQYLALSDS